MTSVRLRILIRPPKLSATRNFCKRMIRCCRVHFYLSASVVLFPPAASADVLGEELATDGFLASVVGFLPADSIDVAGNLNAREIVSRRVAKPRLGGFPDLPAGRLPSGSELDEWESGFAEASIGAIVILDPRLANAGDLTDADTRESWLGTPHAGRIFVSFLAAEIEEAGLVAAAARQAGYEARIYEGPEQGENAGRFYATAGLRLAIDSRSARRFRSDITEFEYLGRRIRRNSTSLFRDDDSRGGYSLSRREPELFLKETLGDEFNQSTVREIIVPGGVALGETAVLDFDIREMIFEENELRLLDQTEQLWRLPPLPMADMRALFDYSLRSDGLQSDAIVDIDADARVKISEALRDTDAGWEIMHADTQPFEYIRNLNVSKSVVVDVGVTWQSLSEAALSFTTDYEVRFLSADSMRIAQTRAALVFAYDAATQTSRHTDSWGRMSSRLDENLDYAGLGDSMEKVAGYAGWVALFRYTLENDIPFLRGRYEFLKQSKAGRRTPARYTP